MSFTNISKYPAAVYEQMGYALASVATEVKSSGAKISTAFGNSFIALDKVKSNPGQFGKLLLLGSYSVELLKVTALKPAVTAFGVGAMVFDVFSVGETVDYVVSNVYKQALNVVNYVLDKGWAHEPFINAKNDPNNFLTQLTFGVTNLGEAALWAHDKKLMDLSVSTAKIIGSMTVAAFAGYIVLTVNTVNKLNAPAPTPLSTATAKEAAKEAAEYEANRKSNVLSLIWTVSEVALIAIPLAGFAPATSVLLAGRIVAKSAAIASFLYKN